MPKTDKKNESTDTPSYPKNLKISKNDLQFIRTLEDFDLTMLISEIHDNGWNVAQRTLSIMRGALAVRNKTDHEKIPIHVCSLYYEGETQNWKTFPIGKHSGIHRCKYCNATHGNWWRMDDEDYGYKYHIILCGLCEHTSPYDKDLDVSWHGERLTEESDISHLSDT